MQCYTCISFTENILFFIKNGVFYHQGLLLGLGTLTYFQNLHLNGKWFTIETLEYFFNTCSILRML